MIIQTLYTYQNDETGKSFLSFSPLPRSSHLMQYRLIADEGKYLYNTKMGIIKKAVTIPFFMKNEWEEREYDN